MPDCRKRAFGTEQEAEQAARSTEQEHAKAAGAMTVYRCDTCPDRPWHTRNRAKKYRGEAGVQQRRATGGLSVERRLDPDVLATLRARVAEEEPPHA